MHPRRSDDIELHPAGSMASAEAPLMADDRAEEDDEYEYDDDEHGAGLDVPRSAAVVEEGAPGLFVWLLTVSAGISGLLFGYDTGVISATLVSVGTSLSGRALTPLDKSVITSATALAALVASPLSSLLADGLGRRRVVLLADGLFVLGAVGQALSATVASMVAGRAVVGAAVGAASFAVPLYIAEAAPAAHRGRLVTMNVLFITLGQVAAYVVGWAFAEHYGGSPDSGWRWMVGLGAVPAAVQAVLLLLLPETPRWLVRAGRSAEARSVLKRVYGGGRGSARLVESVLGDIEAEIWEEEGEAGRPRAAPSWSRRSRLAQLGSSWSELFAVRRNRRALAIACLLQGLQQLCGFNSLMYFSATIFTMLGFTVPTLTSLTVAVTNFCFTVVALLLIDRIGRRRVLLYSIPFMVLGLLLAAYGFSLTDLSTADTADAGGSPDGRGPVVILASLMMYVAAYAIGLGNVPWMQSELFALNVRSLGSGLATGTNWLANFVIGLTFLPLMEALTPPWTFVLYAAICGAGYVLVQRVYPETTGLSLEEAASLLEGDDWGVR